MLQRGPLGRGPPGRSIPANMHVPSSSTSPSRHRSLAWTHRDQRRAVTDAIRTHRSRQRRVKIAVSPGASRHGRPSRREMAKTVRAWSGRGVATVGHRVSRTPTGKSSWTPTPPSACGRKLRMSHHAKGDTSRRSSSQRDMRFERDTPDSTSLDARWPSPGCGVLESTGARYEGYGGVWTILKRALRVTNGRRSLKDLLYEVRLEPCGGKRRSMRLAAGLASAEQ